MSDHTDLPLRPARRIHPAPSADRAFTVKRVHAMRDEVEQVIDSRAELVDVSMALLVAGFEIGGNMIGRGTALFLRHPGQRDLFMAGDEALQPLEVIPDRDRFTGVHRVDGRPVAVLAWNSPNEALRLRRELLDDPRPADAPTPTAPAAPAAPAAGMPVPQ
ncbi:hypothetical protein [Streptomyces sp. NPDC053720]|uniref:hypothetical protein n=1 Tax=Streptomyces sp. NPDC053720 TaxID=3154855 RepID=UPI00342E501D